MRSTAPLWKFGEVNPSSNAFKELAEGTVVSFMPLEAVWPGKRADYAGRLAWSSKQSYTQFSRGDILIPKITPTFEAGRTVIAEIDTEFGLASTEVHVVRARDNADPRYLQYCFQSQPFLDEGASALQGVGNLRRISPRFVQELRVLDVDRRAQQRIANYLDRETVEIDAMIAKMDELAGQLEARRSAVIDGAFVEDFVRSSAAVHLMADVTVGIVNEPSKLYVTAGAGVPALRGVNVAPGKVRAEEMVEISHEGHSRNQKSALREGDLVTVRTGQAGVTAVVPPEWAGANAVDLVITRPRNGLSAQYLYWFLSSSLAKDQMNAETVGAVQSHFNVGGLKRLRLPITRHDEQQRIADHLDEVTGKIDAMLAKVAELKSLLTERRAALITDIVTGRKEVA